MQAQKNYPKLFSFNIFRNLIGKVAELNLYVVQVFSNLGHRVSYPITLTILKKPDRSPAGA